MNDIKVDPFKNNDVLQGKITAVGDKKVEYQGRRFTDSSGAHSKLHRLVAKLFTSLAELFEDYNKTISLVRTRDKKFKGFVRGVDLKKDIDKCVHNLDAITDELKVKEKELKKYEKILKKQKKLDEFITHFKAASVLRSEIASLKSAWEGTKKNIQDLQINLNGTVFENSTTLIRLERSERNLDQQLNHFDDKSDRTWSKLQARMNSLVKIKDLMISNRSNLDDVVNELKQRDYSGKYLDWEDRRIYARDLKNMEEELQLYDSTQRADEIEVLVDISEREIQSSHNADLYLRKLAELHNSMTTNFLEFRDKIIPDQTLWRPCRISLPSVDLS